jgi:hypothetical protein
MDDDEEDVEEMDVDEDRVVLKTLQALVDKKDKPHVPFKPRKVVASQSSADNSVTGDGF